MTENPIPLVLVVVPDPLQRDIIMAVLKRNRCEPIQTKDPVKALEIVSKKHPSLIILDSFIPGSSGIELLQEMNQKKILKHSAVILLSSLGFPELIQKAKDSGAHEFIIKPFDTDDLSKRIQILLKI